MNRIFQLIRTLLIGALLLPLASCAEPMATVSVSAINYTDKDLNSFVFQDPQNPKRVAGGPSLRPYEAGGTMCCYSLPKKWRPGIKVKLVYDWWEGSGVARKYQEQILEVPKYPGKEPGMLWAIFNADGSVEVVSSDYDPGHAKWPGQVKHWPVPSLEYKRKLWAEEVVRQKENIQLIEELLSDFSPSAMQETWTRMSEHSKEKLKPFSGPLDQTFAAYLKKDYTKALAEDREILKKLELSKP